jgi:hypothetical protein
MSKRFQYQHHAKGYGPIRVRVIANSSVTPTPAPELSRPATIEVCTPIVMGIEKKNERALLVRRCLEQVREWKEIREDKDALQTSWKCQRRSLSRHRLFLVVIAGSSKF